MIINRLIVGFLFSSLMLNITTSQAQLIYKSASDDKINEALNTYSITAKNKQYSVIEGSPYYTENFVMADLRLSDETLLKGVFARLDLYKADLEIQLGGEKRVVSNPEKVYEITWADERLLYFPNSDVLALNGFYKAYYASHSKVLAKQEVIFKPAEVANSNYAADKPDRFSRSKEVLYFVFPDSSVLEIVSKKQFYKEVQSLNPDLFNFIKENKINPTKIKDLVELAMAIDESEHISD